MPASTELSHDCYAIVLQLELDLAPFRMALWPSIAAMRTFR
jgi:hypothetical protein